MRQTPDRILAGDDEVAELDEAEMFADIPPDPATAESLEAEAPYDEPHEEPYEEPYEEASGSSSYEDAVREAADAVPDADQSEDDGFVTDPAVSTPEPAQDIRDDEMAESVAFQSTTVEAETTEEDEDVIDLYALGAVDYAPGGAHA